VNANVIRHGNTVLAIDAEVPVYELLDIDVEDGLKCIKRYLWNYLFGKLVTKEIYEKLWEAELKPLAKRALTDTYKIFHYFDPGDSTFISNDNSLLINGIHDEDWEFTLLVIDFPDSKRSEVVEPLHIDVLLEDLPCEFIGDYFVLYAKDELGKITRALSYRLYRDFNSLLYHAERNYDAWILALSARVKERVQSIKTEAEGILRNAYYQDSLRGLITCFLCDLDMLAVFLEALSDGSRGKVYGVETESLARILKVMGFELPTITRGRAGNIEEILGDLTEKNNSLLAAMEIYKMRRDGRWYGKVDLGRWEVHIVDLPDMKPLLVVFDKTSHKVYAGHLSDLESAEYLEGSTEELIDKIEDIFTTLLQREDAPPELLKLLSTILLSRSLIA